MALDRPSWISRPHASAVRATKVKLCVEVESLRPLGVRRGLNRTIKISERIALNHYVDSHTLLRSH